MEISKNKLGKIKLITLISMLLLITIILLAFLIYTYTDYSKNNPASIEELIKETSYIEIQLFDASIGLTSPITITDTEVIEKLRKELNTSKEVNGEGVGVNGECPIVTFYYKDGSTAEISGYNVRTDNTGQFLFSLENGERNIYLTNTNIDLEEYINNLYKIHENNL